jgi:hypothetical protein
MMGMSWMGSKRFKRVGNSGATIIVTGAASHWQHGMKQQPSTYSRTP